MNVEQYEDCLTDKKKKIIVGVAGSRKRNSVQDLDLLDNYVVYLINKSNRHNVDLEFVSGGCPLGADAFIKQLCLRYGITLKEHLPEQVGAFADYYIRVRSFHTRNRLIAEDCNFLICMPSYDEWGSPKGGSANTISHCEELGKKVVLL